MATVVVYGSSDDLIEVEGDLAEEFEVYSDRGGLEFSDGTRLTFRYDNEGRWRFEFPAGQTPGSAVTIRYCPVAADDPDDKDYSDRVTIQGPFEWVKLLEASS